MPKLVKRFHTVWFFLWVAALYHNPVPAQKIDTTVWMDELSVTAFTLTGSEVDTVNLYRPANRLRPLNQLLRAEGNIYFRGFGPGSSSTISMFGSKSNEVALIWNGIQISNPMLGVNDYSLVSTADLTSLRIAGIGQSTIYGAGSGAGAIILEQGITQSLYPVMVSAGWSKLNEFTGTGSYTQSKGSWKSRTSINALHSKNNYRYETISGNIERLPHATSRFINLSHHSEIHRGKNKYWTISAWARKHSREIPPTLTEQKSEAEQSDGFARSLIQLHVLKPRHYLNIKAYYGYQSQRYQNGLINLDAHHRFHNIQIRIDNQWQPLPSIYLKYGFQNNYFSSLSDNYDGQKYQNRISTYAQLHYKMNRIPLGLMLLVKPEWVSGQPTGWTTEIKFRYIDDQTGRWMVFANQNMAWPTLNDLYWIPGGNPGLLPERNRVVGLSWDKSWPRSLTSSSTIYYRRAENWIQWLPGDLGFWRPVNAHDGESYGINLEVEKDFGYHVDIQAGYQFVRTYLTDNGDRRYQAIYTPVHMWSIGGIYTIDKQWEWELSGQFTSTRYVATDHSELLNPYLLWHTSLCYKMKNIPWTIGFHINNIFSTDYQGIKNRPMPGRQIQLNTILKF